MPGPSRATHRNWPPHAPVASSRSSAPEHHVHQVVAARWSSHGPAGVLPCAPGSPPRSGPDVPLPVHARGIRVRLGYEERWRSVDTGAATEHPAPGGGRQRSPERDLGAASTTPRTEAEPPRRPRVRTSGSKGRNVSHRPCGGLAGMADTGGMHRPWPGCPPTGTSGRDASRPLEEGAGPEGRGASAATTALVAPARPAASPATHGAPGKACFTSRPTRQYTPPRGLASAGNCTTRRSPGP